MSAALSTHAWEVFVRLVAACLVCAAMENSPSQAEEAPLRAVDPRALSEDNRRQDIRIQPPALPRLQHALPDNAVPEGAAELTFVYRRLRIEGASALDPDALARAWPHPEGETASVADLFTFAAAVTRAYRAAGYLLSQAVVPAQTIRDGAVSVRVIEGHIEKVVVAGKVPTRVRDRILRMAMPVVEERPVTLRGIEGVLLRVQDLAGVDIRGTISPGETLGGAVLVMDIVYERFGFSADYANTLPETLGRDVLSVGGEARLVGVDLLRISASASPGKVYRQVSVLTRTALKGTDVGLAGSWTRTQPDGEGLLGTIRHQGRYREFELSASHPILRNRLETYRIGGEVSASEYRSELAGLDQPQADRLWTASVWGDYQRAASGAAVTWIRGTLLQGLDIWGASGESRQGGSPRFTAMKWEGRHERSLGIVGGGVVSMTGMLRGQAALGSAVLLSGAECYYGGRRFGAGFDPGTLSGDHCAMVAARLRWAKFVKIWDGTQARLRLYWSADAGWVRQKGTLEAGERRSTSASSTSVGASLLLAPGVSIDFGAAWPLTLPGELDVDRRPRLIATFGFRY